MRETAQALRNLAATPGFVLGVMPVWRAIRRLTRPEVRIVTGGVAFYALFSIFPLIYLTLTLLIAILPRDISEQIAGSIGQILAANVQPLRADEIGVISALTPQGLTFRALAAVIVVGFTASSGAKAAITGIRMIAGTVGKSGIIRFQGISLLMTALLILLVWLLGAMQLAITIFQQGDAGEAGRFAGEIAAIASTLWITKWVASFLVFYLVIALSLRGHVESGRALLLGAIAGSAAWLSVTWLFQLYLRFSVLDTVYGALASVILGFVWLIASVTSLLLGAALAAEWSKVIKRS
ncbi:MAG: YhjD/YihY/BrkB family envelope integrity protein [Pseudomonadota bacterium]